VRDTRPKPPPFAVGRRVRYVGRTSFCYGDNPMVEPGDVGIVTEITEGWGGRPDLGDEFAEPLDGWSTVDIKGNRIAVGAESLDRYVAVSRS
jgi:hypothetical protein